MSTNNCLCFKKSSKPAGRRSEMDVVDGKFGSFDMERSRELEMFRERWRAELEENKENPFKEISGHQAEPSMAGASKRTTVSSAVESPSRSKFEIAAEIFREGIKEERSGRFDEAVRLYRRAIQLDPDIEHKFDKSISVKKRPKNRPINEKSNEEDEDGVEKVSTEELLENLMQYSILDHGTCQAAGTSTSTHISALPFELIQYLTQWIVSSELDLLSLEQFARVARGFYRIARDSLIWKLACQKIWSDLCGRPEDFQYGSWREMLILRPQVRFNGVYISRISYVRPGEASFIDHKSGHFQAWYSVHYYRFLRFFPDGTVLYANTPDEPLVLIPRLRSDLTAQTKEGQNGQILTGHYRLSADGGSVIVFLRRDIFREEYNQRGYRNRRGKKTEGHETLTMEFVIHDVRERLHARLDWRRYTILRSITGKNDTESTVGINQHFPSCFFSRVKSYSAQSEHPLI